MRMQHRRLSRLKNTTGQKPPSTPRGCPASVSSGAGSHRSAPALISLGRSVHLQACPFPPPLLSPAELSDLSLHYFIRSTSKHSRIQPLLTNGSRPWAAPLPGPARVPAPAPRWAPAAVGLSSLPCSESDPRGWTSHPTPCPTARALPQHRSPDAGVHPTTCCRCAAGPGTGACELSP